MMFKLRNALALNYLQQLAQLLILLLLEDIYFGAFGKLIYHNIDS